MENLRPIKCYDKPKMNVFTLSLKKNFRWGLIYFDQFILSEYITNIFIKANIHYDASIVLKQLIPLSQYVVVE